MNTVVFEKGGEKATLNLNAATLDADIMEALEQCPAMKTMYNHGKSGGLTHEEMLKVLLISAISFRIGFEQMLRPTRIVIEKKV